MTTSNRKQPKLTRHDHHSRDCTQPTTTFPWLLVTASLPVSMLLFYNVILPVVFGFVGISFPAVHPYHVLHDIWLRLVFPCPILVDSQTRHFLQTHVTKGTEYSKSTYEDLLSKPMGVHRNYVNTFTFLEQDAGKGLCIFHNWAINKTEKVSTGMLIPGIAPASLNLDHPCVAGRLTCDDGISLSQVLEGFGEPRDAVDDAIVVSEVMSLIPAQLNASESFLDIVYIQINGSLLLFCGAMTNQNPVVVHSLQPSDAIRINYEDCPKLYMNAKDDLSIGILIQVERQLYH